MTRTQAFIICVSALSTNAFATRTIYMDDVVHAGTGISAASPLNTLKLVKTKVAELVRVYPTEDIVVKIAPGLYRGPQQIVSWSETEVNPARTVTLEASDINSRPIFDGEGLNGTRLFTLNYTRGRSNIVLRGLHLKNWVNGVAFLGQRDDDASANSTNEITNCIFENIGNAYYRGAAPKPTGFSAIGLTNSDNNIIRGNSFINIINSEGGSSLHAIYAAHNSQNNIITENKFTNGSGSQVKFRDASNFNTVDSNDFNGLPAKIPAVQHSYCDQAHRTPEQSPCTKTGGECPSQGTVIKMNSYGGVDLFFENTPVYQPTNTSCFSSTPIPVNQYALIENFDTDEGGVDLMLSSARGFAS